MRLRLLPLVMLPPFFKHQFLRSMPAVVSTTADICGAPADSALGVG